jgi:DNA-binding transcriptional ArsR family regulator
MNPSPSTILPALAEPHRRQIVELLVSKGQMNATDIARRFEITPAAVSQHLKVLRNARVLTMEKQAQRRLYQINPAAFDELEAWLRKMKETWSARFDQLDSLLREDQ